MELGSVIYETTNYKVELGKMDYDDRLIGYLIRNKETDVIEWSTKVLPEAYHFIDELQEELQKFTGELERVLN